MSNLLVDVVLFVTFWAMAAAFAWLLVRSLNRGVWYWHRIKVLRSEQPIAFWIGPIAYVAIIAFSLSAPPYLVWIVSQG